MTEILLKKGEEKRLLKGHPWIYDNEIETVKGKYEPGDQVDVFSWNHRFIGRGFINPASRITVRLYSREREELDEAFFRRRISAAWEYRRRVSDARNCRVVFAEADLLPALIVDKFHDETSGGEYLILQTLALGMDLRKDLIVKVLREIFSPAGIYERNDVPVREKEGMEQRTGFLGDPFPTEITVQENGILFKADLAGGQKTGYFLDQRENHAAIRPYCEGAEVLDAFSHTGGFALHAARYGAKMVTAVDISADAVAVIGQNAELNGVADRVRGVTENVFDYLRGLQQTGRRFDVIILDPPAFSKSRSTVKGAYRGYKDINLRAMKLLNSGGYLVTCSCSQSMNLQLFRSMVEDAAFDAKRHVRLVEVRTQAKDHPILLGYDESFYLKCLILQVM